MAGRGSPFVIEEMILETPKGSRTALTFTPRGEIRVGRKRLEELRRGVVTGLTDRAILAAARAHRGKGQLMVFRSKSASGKTVWDLSEDLNASELSELGLLLVRSQIPTYRGLAKEGALVMLHLELSPRASGALKRGTREVLRELRMRSLSDGTMGDAGDDAVRKLDTWLLSHLSFYLGLSFDRAMKGTIPDMVPLLEQREPTLKLLLSAAPRRAFAEI